MSVTTRKPNESTKNVNRPLCSIKETECQTETNGKHSI